MNTNYEAKPRFGQAAIALTVLACLTPSMAVNVAHTAASSVPLALAGGMSVLLAAIAVMAAEGAFRQRNLALASIATLTAVICIGYNLTAALGAASHGRAVKQAEGDTRQQVQQLEARRAALSVSKPSAAVEAELNGLRQQPAWTSTRGCVDATLPASRMFCTQYADVQARLAVTVQAEQLDAQIGALRERPMIGDAQGENIAALLGHAGMVVTPAGVGLMLNTLLAVLVEIIAAFGPVIIVAAFRSDEKTGQKARKAPTAARAATVTLSKAKGKGGRKANVSRDQALEILRAQARANNGKIIASGVALAASLGVSRSTVCDPAKGWLAHWVKTGVVVIEKRGVVRVIDKAA